MSEARGIRVLCRFRPQNKIEDERGGACCVTYTAPQSCKVKDHEFNFDRVFTGESTQREIYEEVRPAVADLLEGFNATVFAYGQTSSGKTFTMQGPSIDDPEQKGVIPRVVEDIFANIQQAPEHVEFSIRASYLEIYLERIRDLLDASRDNLKVREDRTKGIYVEGQKEVFVSSVAEVFEVLRVGQCNRAIAATGMNAQSSRSHSVFLLGVTARNTRDQTTRTGKLYLVDLAGSEKVGKTGAAGLTLNEAKMINKSLSALGNVIKALTEGKAQHIPYRDSKLTRILQESLGGNARTTLIVNCSSSSYNEEETLSTLRFGMRAKTIKNKARANVDRSPAELKAMLARAETEIASLKELIASLKSGSGGGGGGGGGGGDGQKLLEMTEKLEAVQKQLETAQDEKTQLLDAQEAIRDSLAEKTTELERQTQVVAELSAQSLELQATVSETELQLRSANIKLEEAAVQGDALRQENERLKGEIDELQMQQELRSSSANSSGGAASPHYGGEDGSFCRPRGASVVTPTTTAATTETSHDYSLAEADIRQSLQQGFERVRQLGSRLLESNQAPTESDVQGAIAEIKLLGEQLVATTPRLPNISQSPVPVATAEPAASITTITGEVTTTETASVSSQQTDQPKHEEVTTAEEANKALTPTTTTATVSSDEQLRKEYEQKIAELTAKVDALTAQNEALKQDSGIAAKLQAELAQIRDTTEQKLGELSKVREALLQDLENRCLRVVDLQMQLDEMSEKFDALRKTKVISNERQLKQQILNQQREIQKAAREIKRLSGENQRLRNEDDSSRKQLAIRVEYVRQLESEIRELQKALRDSIVQSGGRSTQQQQQQQQLQQQQAQFSSPQLGRISKPIRGGMVIAGVSPVASREPSSPSSVSFSAMSSTATTPIVPQQPQQQHIRDEEDEDEEKEDTDEGEMTMEAFLSLGDGAATSASAAPVPESTPLHT